MKYKIELCEVKKEGSTNGRNWKITEMTLIDEGGIKTEKVSTFNSVAIGQELEGEIKQNDKGYLNFIAKLEPPQFMKQQSNTAFKTAQMEKVMDRKEQSIGKFQDTKDWSIKTSSTMRDAVLLTIAEKGDIPMRDEELGQMVVKWRKFLWNHFDVNLEDTDAISGELN